MVCKASSLPQEIFILKTKELVVLTLQRTIFGETYINLHEYNALELVLRGDGRGYIMNIHTDTLHPEDLYQTFVYTRGGPFWQTIHVSR